MRWGVVKLYGRLLRFLRPHAVTLVAAIVCMSGFAALSGFSIAMIVPFTEIVLSDDSPAAIADRHGAGRIERSEATGDGEMTGEATLGDAGADGEASAPEGLRKRLEARFYGLIAGADRSETIGRLCIALVLVFLLKNVFWYAQSFLIVKVEQFVIRDIRNRIFRHYQTLSLDYFSKTNTGTLVSRVTNDVDLVRGAIANGFASLVRQSLVLLAYLVTVLLASWQLFVFAVIVLPPNLWLIDRIGHTLRAASRVSQTRMAGLTAVVEETIGGMRIVKAFGLEKSRMQRFQAVTGEYAKVMVRMTRIGSLASPLTEMLGVLVAALLLWFAGTRLDPEGNASGRFMLFLVGMLSMMQPIKILAQVNISVQQGLAAARRVFDVLESEPTVRDRPDARPIAALERGIAFEGVSFDYRDDVPVLRDIELEISKGSICALVGPSGAGKSTLADLIPRFYDPTAGGITLDGVDLRDLRVDALRAMIGIVTQETILFEGTVRDNIAMGTPGAGAVEVEAAARAANAHAFIEELPEGYETWIGDRGRLLSGGQRQRISIARALLRNPPILILDEATSALDSESEALVQEAISRLLEHRTSIIVAHRLSTVRHADMIIVLEKGRITERGTHEALMAGGGLYRRLYTAQHALAEVEGTGGEPR